MDQFASVNTFDTPNAADALIKAQRTGDPEFDARWK
jgi:hypothetical protein